MSRSQGFQSSLAEGPFDIEANLSIGHFHVHTLGQAWRRIAHVLGVIRDSKNPVFLEIRQ
jgi:hypothetical protein